MDFVKISIVQSLSFKQPQSVSELSAAIDRSIPSTTKLLNELELDGFVMQIGLAPSTGGRRGIQYHLHVQKFPAVISVALDQYYSSVGVFNFDYSPLVATRTFRNPLDQPHAYKDVLAAISEALKAAGKRDIFAISVTTPGFVDGNKGINVSYTQDSPFHFIKQNIEKEFGIQTILENDSAAIAIAEKHFGRYHDSRDMLVVNLNWGVGLGMIIDSKLFRGHSGFAGEFSHIPLSDTDMLCSCGKRGCLEVEASLLSAIRYVEGCIRSGQPTMLFELYKDKDYITGDELIEAVRIRDVVAVAAIERIAYAIGKGIATLIHIINPERIVISGRGARVGEILLPKLHDALKHYTIERLLLQTELSISEVESPQLLGGVCLAIEHGDFRMISK